MPFDYSRFLSVLEARARKLSGLSLASLAMACASLAVLAATIVIRFLRIPLPSWGLAAFALPPLIAGSIGYAFGRADQPRIPHLLLRIDDTLGLNARLSSLYELRQRGGSIFRQRIESEVRDAIAEWKTALPLGRRTILGGSAGACFIALAVGLAFVPLPGVPESPLDIAEQASTVSEGATTEAADSLPAPSAQATSPLTVKTDPEIGQEGGGPSLETPERDQTLDDVMRDLAGTSPEAVALAPVPSDEIEALARLQSEALRAITQMLEAIHDRLENAPTEPSRLTEEELEGLQQELERGGLPPELQEGLNQLMNRPQPRSVEEIIEDLIEQFGGEEDTQNQSSDGPQPGQPQSTAVAPDAQQIDDFLDELGQASEDGPEGGGPPAGPDDGTNSEGPEGEGAPSTGDRPPMIGADGVEDPDQVGGISGAPGFADEDEELEPAFIREEERAKIGSEGEFVSEFVTEGVPIEWTPDPEGGEPSFQVSYERIVSVLRERGVPEGAIEIVRDYFNAITEGGP